MIGPATLLVGKWGVEEISAEAGAGAGEAPRAIAAIVAVLAMGGLIGAAGGRAQRLLPYRVRNTVEEMLARKAAALDLETLETPAFHDRLARAQQEAAVRPGNMVNDLTILISTVVGILGFLAVLATVHPLLAGLALVALGAQSWAYINSAVDYFGMSLRRTPKLRMAAYLSGVLTGQASAKEARAFGLSDYLLERRARLYSQVVEDLREISSRRFWRDVLGSLVSSVAVGAGLAIAVALHTRGRLSLTDVAVAGGALLLIAGRAARLAAIVGLFYENALFVDDFWSFMALPTKQALPARPLPIALPLRTVKLENVTFSYPGASIPAVKDVSLEIRPGQTVALVGENGAGKTTLVKLLCRLYDPDAGCVTWNDTDLRAFNPEDVRRNIAVIFQDFMQYELSVRENVGFGDVTRLDDLDGVATATRRASAEDLVTGLPDGYETILGRMFEHGRQLSIGQWQKIALARAFFRNAPLVILDEPTAALDPRSERDIFQELRKLFMDRAVLIISHRFSTVRLADWIYVLKNGEVLESGAHDDLMMSRGLYAELFTIQASAYLESNAHGLGDNRRP